MRTRPRWQWIATLAASAWLGPLDSALGDGGLTKGPWLMDLRRDSVTVMAEREVAGPLSVRVWPAQSQDGGVRVLSARDRDDATLHEVRVSGLAPGVRYRYEVRGPGVSPTGGSFTAAPVDDVPFRFVLYGDTRSRQAVHTAAVAAIRREAPEFVVHTGDLMEDGRSEQQWQTFFEIEHDLLRDAVFVPVIGNHEIMRRESNGVENFRRYVHAEPDSPSPELDYTFAYGNVRFVLVNAFDDWSQPEKIAWFDAALARARAEVPNGFVIAVMHQGVCSCGPHGESRALRRAGVDEMLRRHGVDLLVSGHDHLYERGEDEGLRYIVTGGCGAPLYAREHDRDYTLAYSSEHHYVRADVEPGLITLTATRLDGSVIERCRIRHGGGWDCPPGPGASPPPSIPSAGSAGGTPGGLDGGAEDARGAGSGSASHASVVGRHDRGGCGCEVVAPRNAARGVGPSTALFAAVAFRRRRRRTRGRPG